MSKKLHWTQTPEGRAHMSKIARRRARLKAQEKHNTVDVDTIEFNTKPSRDYKVTIERGGTKFQITDVSRRTIVGFIGKLMKSKP